MEGPLNPYTPFLFSYTVFSRPPAVAETGPSGEKKMKKYLTWTGFCDIMIKRLFWAHYAMMREIAAKAGNFRGVCP